MIFIDPEQITHIEAKDHAVIFYCRDGKYKIWDSLKNVEEKVKGLGFIRVHRSFLVSLRYIKEIDDGWVVLDDPDGTEVPVGMKYTDAFAEEIKKRKFLFV